MPKTIPRSTAIRDDLRTEIRETFLYAQRLENIIGVKSRGSSEVFHGKVDFSQPPWNASAANTILELHAWSRDTEGVWRLRAGLSARYRGGSDRNTAKALEALTRLSEAVDDGAVLDARKWLSSWCKRASIALGESESAKRLPRMAGKPGPACPWCKRDTLREMALAGVIFCIDPKCADEEGRRPKAYLECFQNEWVLRWQDNIIGAP